MFANIKFFLASIDFHCKFLCENLHTSNHICMIPVFMVPLTTLFCDAIFKFPCNDTKSSFDGNSSSYFSLLQYVLIAYKTGRVDIRSDQSYK